jgi:acyl-CoA reductase-like NAD-dependent aldehyde dehydrogenase
VGGSMMNVPGFEKGCYVEPSLQAAATLDNVAAREEIFGPVAYFVPFSQKEEAIELVNATDYGLGNSVWTNNRELAQSVILDLHFLISVGMVSPPCRAKYT